MSSFFKKADELGIISNSNSDYWIRLCCPRFESMFGYPFDLRQDGVVFYDVGKIIIISIFFCPFCGEKIRYVHKDKEYK